MPHLTAPPYHTTPHCRRMVLLRLQNIGRGLWGSDGKCKRLMGYPPTLGEEGGGGGGRGGRPACCTAEYRIWPSTCKLLHRKDAC